MDEFDDWSPRGVDAWERTDGAVVRRAGDLGWLGHPPGRGDGSQWGPRTENHPTAEDAMREVGQRWPLGTA